MRKQIYCLLSFLWISCLSVSAADRWAINSAGGITWQEYSNRKKENGDFPNNT